MNNIETQKLFRYFPTKSVFDATPKAADANNNSYYDDGVLVQETPEIKWQDICFIEQWDESSYTTTQKIYTHGHRYNCGDVNDTISLTYALENEIHGLSDALDVANAIDNIKEYIDEDLSFVISSHFNELWERVGYIESGKQSTLTPGQNIEIENNVISTYGFIFDKTLNSFAEGYHSEASGLYSHAEGFRTEASGLYSHAEGYGYVLECEANIRKVTEDEQNILNKYNLSFNYVCTDYSIDETSYFNIYTDSTKTTKLGNVINASTSKGSWRNELKKLGVTGIWLLIDNDLEDGTYWFERIGNESSGQYGSHAEGVGTISSGLGSHAEGALTTASGEGSHTEGSVTSASGDASHAEGGGTTASGNFSHAEGGGTIASSHGSHAEGVATIASGEVSHSEGRNTTASGFGSHAEGARTESSGWYSHAEGIGSLALGHGSHAEGVSGTISVLGNWELKPTLAYSDGSHIEGANFEMEINLEYDSETTVYTIAYSTENEDIYDFSIYWALKTLLFPGHFVFPTPIAECIINGNEYYIITECEDLGEQDNYYRFKIRLENDGPCGSFTGYIGGGVSSGEASHVEGISNITLYSMAHAEGGGNVVFGICGHAEGAGNIAIGEHAHAEGYLSRTGANITHAEGESTYAEGVDSHAEGYLTHAEGNISHAEGNETHSEGDNSHTEGLFTHTKGIASHAEGHGTITNYQSEHAEGEYNKSDDAFPKGFVDLGLSVAWAQYNMGVNISDLSTAEKWYGDYYAWGEIGTKSKYNWNTYRYGSESALTKYCNNSQYGNNGFTDNLTTLDGWDDVVSYSYRNGWRMPTTEEIGELFTVPNTWVTHFKGIYNLNGRIFAKTQDEIDLYNKDYTFNDVTMLFIPASGCFYTDENDNDVISDVNTDCYLWSNSLNTGDCNNAYVLEFNSNDTRLAFYYRCCGFPVRAVAAPISHTQHSIGIGSDSYRANAVEVMNSGAVYIKDFGNYDGTNPTDRNSVQQTVEDMMMAVSGIFNNRGYVFNLLDGSISAKYKQDAGDGGQIVTNSASGFGAHAEGYGTYVSADYGSHAEGLYTNSYNRNEHAEGSYNVSHTSSDNYGDSGNTLHSTGCGVDSLHRANALEIMQNGDIYIKGIGQYNGTNTKVQDNTVQTLQEYIAYLESRIANLESIVIPT